MFMSGTVYWMMIVTKVSRKHLYPIGARVNISYISIIQKLYIKKFCKFVQELRNESQHKIYIINWNN